MDKYDKAVKYLERHPEEINEAWGSPTTYDRSKGDHIAGCLFMIAGNENTHNCGCLTQVRGSTVSVALTPALTKAIRKDKRIPKSPDLITVEDLPVFAEWQRKIDKEIKNIKSKPIRWDWRKY